MQRAEKAFMKAKKCNEKFDALKSHEQKNNTFNREKSARRTTLINCKYYGN